MSAAAVYVSLFSEWLFFVTKPSMFSVLGWVERATVLLAAALPLALVATALALLLTLFGQAWPPAGRRAARRALGALVPALILTTTLLLLVENFTKTVLDFNVGSLTSPLRYLYAVGFVAAALWIHRGLRRFAAARWSEVRNRGAASGLILLVGFSVVAAWSRYQPEQNLGAVVRREQRDLANILILSSDGVRASHMSVYGYERRTTPYLESRAGEFLFSENHFTNSSATAGSIGALLSGKLPTTTGVMGVGSTFRGVHVYQHLPGMLRQLGYYNFEIGANPYADSYNLNLRQGFHVANSRSARSEGLPIVSGLGKAYPSERHFVGLTFERVVDRLGHAFGVSDMQDPYKEATQTGKAWPSDRSRLDELKAEIARGRRPFFAHVHLLDTHGPRFPFSPPRFSGGREQTELWDRDFYDDSIAGFDGHIDEVVGYLEEIGELENTVVIVSSDHGLRWATHERLPLLIRFPRGEHGGRISANTQRVDIAPTLLSYLGVEIPGWMDGRSLLEDELGRLRPIIGAKTKRHGPLGSASLVQCQRWFRANMATGMVQQGTVAGHSDPCGEEELYDADAALDRIVAEIGEGAHFPEPFFVAAELMMLQSGKDPERRERVVQAILDGRTQAAWVDAETAITRIYWDLWTRGTEPAGLVARNEHREPLRLRLAVHSGRGRDFPVRFHVEDGEETHDYVFERAGPLFVDLAEVPPGSDRLFVIWSDTAWSPGGKEWRSLGVKLSLDLSTRLDKLVRTGDPDERLRLTQTILRGEISAASLADDMLVAGGHWDRWTRGAEPAGIVVSNPGDRPTVRRLVVHSGQRADFPVSFYVDDGAEQQEHVFTRAGELGIDLTVPAGSDRLFIVWGERAWTPGVRDRRALGVKLSSG